MLRQQYSVGIQQRVETCRGFTPTHYTLWHPVLVSVSASNDQGAETPYLMGENQIVVTIGSSEIFRILLVAWMGSKACLLFPKTAPTNQHPQHQQRHILQC